MRPPTGWQEVGDRVFRRRFEAYDLNVGLVLGDGEALLVDTRSSLREGEALRGQVRAVTSSPVRHVVNTHAHFDHCFGNAAFGGAALWGQRGCAAALRDHGERQRAEAAADPGIAGDAAATPIVPPRRLVARGRTVRVGGRPVTLRHHGRGHTDHDLTVTVPGAGVTFAGDLVEEGAPPAFDDAWPLEWPATLRALLASAGGVIVPGHGDIVDRAFARAQADALEAVASLAAAVRDGTLDLAGALAASPLPAEPTRTAITRVTGTGPPG